MNGKERLEEIKERYNFGSIDRFVDAKLVNPQELKWLIEQAERVEELEDKCNYLSDMNEMLVDLNGVLPDEPELYIKLKKEIKRYREAIEFGIEYLKNSDIRQVQLVVTALKSALEGEE